MDSSECTTVILLNVNLDSEDPSVEFSLTKPDGDYVEVELLPTPYKVEILVDGLHRHLRPGGRLSKPKHVAFLDYDSEDDAERACDALKRILDHEAHDTTQPFESYAGMASEWPEWRAWRMFLRGLGSTEGRRRINGTFGIYNYWRTGCAVDTSSRWTEPRGVPDGAFGVRDSAETGEIRDSVEAPDQVEVRDLVEIDNDTVDTPSTWSFESRSTTPDIERLYAAVDADGVYRRGDSGDHRVLTSTEPSSHDDCASLFEPFDELFDEIGTPAILHSPSPPIKREQSTPGRFPSFSPIDTRATSRSPRVKREQTYGERFSWFSPDRLFEEPEKLPIEARIATRSSVRADLSLLSKEYQPLRLRILRELANAGFFAERQPEQQRSRKRSRPEPEPEPDPEPEIKTESSDEGERFVAPPPKRRRCGTGRSFLGRHNVMRCKNGGES